MLVLTAPAARALASKLQQQLPKTRKERLQAQWLQEQQAGYKEALSELMGAAAESKA